MGREAGIQFELESADGFRQVAHVSIAAEHLEARRDKTAREIAAKIKLPGFRKGKVPPKLVRTRYSSDVEQETFEALIPEAYREVVDGSEHLHPIDTPRVEHLKVEDGLQFDLVFEVRPEIALDALPGLEVEQRRAKITDDRVQQALEELAERHAQWEAVERGAQAGDAMRIEYVPMNDDGSRDEANRNESYSLELGADGVLPEFNSALLGLEVGDDTEVEVVYPADYPREDLQGKTMRFEVKIHEIREKRVPELDDAFAAERTDAADLEELRQKLRQELEKAADAQSLRNLDDAILSALLEKVQIPIPPSLEARYLQGFADDYEQMTGQKLDEARRKEFDEQFRQRAQRNTQRAVVLDNLRRQNQIQASDEDVQAKIGQLAEERGMEVEQFERAVRAANNLDALRNDVEEEKVLAFMRSQVKAKLVEFDSAAEQDQAKAEG